MELGRALRSPEPVEEAKQGPGRPLREISPVGSTDHEVWRPQARLASKRADTVSRRGYGNEASLRVEKELLGKETDHV